MITTALIALASLGAGYLVGVVRRQKGCEHDWEPWRLKYEGSIYQRRACKHCGEIRERSI